MKTLEQLAKEEAALKRKVRKYRFCQGCGRVRKPNEQTFRIGKPPFRFTVCLACKKKFDKEKKFKEITL